jgi:hypothetical protein
MHVHVTDGFYAGMPFSSASYFGWEFTILYVAPAMTQQLAAVQVPAGQVLDATQLRFFAFYPDGANMPVLYRDEAFLNTNSYLTISINGRIPWDVTATFVYTNPLPPPPTLGSAQAGVRWLNRNVIDDWGDAPGHLIATENQTLELTLTVAGIPIPGGGQPLYLGAAIHGRWLTMHDWARIKARL